MDTNIIRIFVFYFVCIITTKAGRVFHLENRPVICLFECLVEIPCDAWQMCATFSIIKFNNFKTIRVEKIEIKLFIFYENWACAYQRFVLNGSRFTLTLNIHTFVFHTNVSTIISCARIVLCVWMVRQRCAHTFLMLNWRIGSDQVSNCIKESSGGISCNYSTDRPVNNFKQ